MKKLFIVMFVVVMIAVLATPGLIANGCNKHGDKKMMGHGDQGNCCMMMKELNLTEAQQAEIDKLKQGCMEAKKNLHTKMMELHQKKCDLMKADKPEKETINKIIDESAKLKAEMMKGCVDCKIKVSALLTPEQLKKMQEMKSKCGKGEAMGCCKSAGHCHGCKGPAQEVKKEAPKCGQAPTCGQAKKSCS